ncbi:class I SAM-dependent DNA methyltransferase, partial [bacterium]|nr:class I SAM-dependent DNA methyltransferase [bacterium]
ANETTDKKNMAAVHCVIIGFSATESSKPKIVFINEDEKIEAKNINGYLLDAPDLFIEKRTVPLCSVPPLLTGSQRIDNDEFIFTDEEKAEFIKTEPFSEKYFRRWYGAEEFLYNSPRWCLYLGNCSPAELRKMKSCMKILEAVKQYRLGSRRAATVKAALYPARFGLEVIPTTNFMIVPVVSSEKRFYLPIGFMTPDNLCSNQVNLIPDAALYHFGVLTSSVHNAWMRAVCGRLEMRYRYSKEIVYNNFPWPDLSDCCAATSPKRRGKDLKADIEETAQAILDARAKYPDSSLADLYDETTMPPELRKAHKENDKAVMSAYGFDPKMTEAEIVAELLRMYEKLTAKLQPG